MRKGTEKQDHSWNPESLTLYSSSQHGTTLPRIAQQVHSGALLGLCMAQRTTFAIWKNAKWVFISLQVPNYAESNLICLTS